MACRKGAVLTLGSCAIETREPCQVRKEAAVSEPFYVTQDRLGRAANLRNAYDGLVDNGCTVLHTKSMLAFIGELFL